MDGRLIRFTGLAIVASVVLFLAAPAAARTGPVELGAAAGGPPLLGDPDPRYRQTLGLYDAITPENDLKMYYLRPARDRFEFAVADAMVEFAAAHGQQVHGHTLVWCNDSSLPGWLRSGGWTRTALLAVMAEHINAVLSRYRGRITSWDVVNEALDDDGTRRDCLWQRVIGDDWIEQAFRLAHRADPSLRLFYNEVRADTPNAKLDSVVALTRGLRARGVPLDGVGLQYHLIDRMPAQPEVEAAIARFGDLGLDVHLSELDVPVWSLGATLEAKLGRQAAAYRAIASACQAQPACFRITTWGFTDRYTWRCCNARPLPFDEEYRPKPAWAALQEVLRPPPPAPEPPPQPEPVPAPDPAPQPPPAGAPAQAAAASTTAAPATLERPGAPALGISVRIRRQRLATWRKRRAVAVALRLRGAEAAQAELVVWLRRRVIGHSELDLTGAAPRTAAIPLRRTASLRRAGRSRVVVEALVVDPAGRRAGDRARRRVPLR